MLQNARNPRAQARSSLNNTERTHRDDDYHEGAFYLAALCVLSVVLVMTGGALALIGSCR